jgi:nitrate/nitrite-specific signal transduction histidine kinase
MGSSSEDAPGFFAKSEELLDILRKGKTFAEELLRENERLRLRILQLERARMDAPTAGEAELARLRAENARLRERVDMIDRRFAEIEIENSDFVRRFVEVEAQNEALASLYVASYQLHATLDPHEVTQAISEILTGLVGARDYAILLVDDEANGLVLASGEGVEERFSGGRAPLDAGLEGRVATTGATYFGSAATGDPETACVPLTLKRERVGVIAIYGLLSQKNGGYSAVDHELLNLLAGQAAAALVSSRLYAATDRRL